MLTSTSAELLRLRARFLLSIAWGTIVVSGLGLLPAIIGAFQNTLANPFALVILGVTILLNSLWLFLLNRPQLHVIGMYGLLFTLFIGFLFTPPPVLLLTGTLTVITAALVARRSIYLGIISLVIIRLALDVIRIIDTSSGGLPREIYDYMLPMMTFVVTAVVIRYFVQTTQTSIGEAVRVASSLQSANDIERVIVQQGDADEMMRLTINSIHDRFGFYHAQVFLLNETGDQAVLRASTGDIGHQLLMRRHQLTVGSQSVVGQAVLRGAPVLVADTENEVVFFRNELLPNTRAELTIPLKDRGKVIGALDIQSTTPGRVE